jgi:glycosyltransferase involved in cell wall biosynthesis
MDDLLFDLPANNPYKATYDRARPAMLQGLVESQVVTASTTALCDYLRAFNPNVHLLPNYLDDHLWPLAPRPARPQVGPISIGYMGGPSHAADIASIAPVLERLLQRYPRQLRLRFWGIAAPPGLAGHTSVDQQLPGLPDYSAFAAYMQTQTVDIVVGPLCDNLFNRCKSAAKFLEYSALALPGVYSSGPPYSDVVQPGLNGFLAGSSEEWEQSLCRLIEDGQLRRVIGEAAQETVTQRFRLSQHAGEWVDVYQMAVASQWDPLSDSIPARLARQARLWAEETAAQSVRTAPPPTYWQRLKKALRRRIPRRPAASVETKPV